MVSLGGSTDRLLLTFTYTTIYNPVNCFFESRSDPVLHRALNSAAKPALLDSIPWKQHTKIWSQFQYLFIIILAPLVGSEMAFETALRLTASG